MKFIAQMGDPIVKPDHVVIKLKAAANQLPTVLQMATFTGAGKPSPFTLRIMAKDAPGLVSEGAYLHNIKIKADGDTVITIHAGGFDVGVLMGLVGDKNVAVSARMAD